MVTDAEAHARRTASSAAGGAAQQGDAASTAWKSPQGRPTTRSRTTRRSGQGGDRCGQERDERRRPDEIERKTQALEQPRRPCCRRCTSRPVARMPRVPRRARAEEPKKNDVLDAEFEGSRKSDRRRPDSAEGHIDDVKPPPVCDRTAVCFYLDRDHRMAMRSRTITNSSTYEERHGSESRGVSPLAMKFHPTAIRTIRPRSTASRNARSL